MISFSISEGNVSSLELIIMLFFLPDGEPEFFFGLATAPAHVEDKLNDAWLQFAEEKVDEESEAALQQPADALIASAAGDGGSQPAVPAEAKDKSKKKKTLKIAMEAMIRGFEKTVEEEEDEEEEQAPASECNRNVAAWHNVPRP